MSIGFGMLSFLLLSRQSPKLDQGRKLVTAATVSVGFALGIGSMAGECERRVSVSASNSRYAQYVRNKQNMTDDEIETSLLVSTPE